VALFVALQIGIIASLLVARQWAISSFGSEEARGQWQQWRTDVANQPQGSVARQVPKSEEPPALVLLTDYFLTCTAISVVLSTALYFTFVFILRGMSRHQPPAGRAQ
jgi:hypothetical protein